MKTKGNVALALGAIKLLTMALARLLDVLVLGLKGRRRHQHGRSGKGGSMPRTMPLGSGLTRHAGGTNAGLNQGLTK